ncbi:DUF58 domain-containing protein [Alicyclobacillus sp. SO9]|uniref:DUF58 domain-containing protein n=1 Tax=Alicyclobacillus sp. SO9 TaxID=2665646 RepID=UPI0018E879A5|nr:DUF58 domain-containing protein [Alicyclobacillus sp. SO9]QQE77771.1 DUF58 domain-containing protein [Alicyclobacillus sp. SO9]
MTSWLAWWKTWRRRAKRTVPSYRLTGIVAGVGLLNFLLANWLIHSVWVWGALLLVLAALTLADLVDLRTIEVHGTRDVTPRPQLYIPMKVTGLLSVRPSVRRIAGVDLGFSGPLEQESKVEYQPANHLDSLSFSQVVVPVKRGYTTVSPMDIKVRSRFGLWDQYVRIGQAEEVLVIPDLTTWRRAVAALERTLSQEGAHVKPLSAGDSEFSHLAEYVPDDDPRRINWGATARRGRLMKNSYQAEQGQQLIVAVDASRYMQVTLEDGKTRLDYAIECAAALASASLDVGDRVGVLAFTHKMLFRLPPRHGRRHWEQIVEELAGVEAEMVQGGYEGLLRHLTGSFHRRSLLVIVSELEGLQSDPAFLGILHRVQRQHPVLFVTLTDIDAQKRAEQVPAKTEDVSRLAAAHWVLNERNRVRQAMIQKGVSVVESQPSDVVVDTVAAYLRRRLRRSR